MEEHSSHPSQKEMKKSIPFAHNQVIIDMIHKEMFRYDQDSDLAIIYYHLESNPNSFIPANEAAIKLFDELLEKNPSKEYFKIATVDWAGFGELLSPDEIKVVAFLSQNPRGQYPDVYLGNTLFGYPTCRASMKISPIMDQLMVKGFVKRDPIVQGYELHPSHPLPFKEMEPDQKMISKEAPSLK